MAKTELEIALLSRKTKQIELLPKVKVFLEAISRNSLKSKRAYSSGITVLQNFLNENEQKQRYYGCNCETIILALLENKVNVYELFDRFVSRKENQVIQRKKKGKNIAGRSKKRRSLKGRR